VGAHELAPVVPLQAEPPLEPAEPFAMPLDGSEGSEATVRCDDGSSSAANSEIATDLTDSERTTLPDEGLGATSRKPFCACWCQSGARRVGSHEAAVLTGHCALCQRLTAYRCSGCGVEFYCCHMHQRKSWKVGLRGAAPTPFPARRV
jgi:hypothetical protein